MYREINKQNKVVSLVISLSMITVALYSHRIIKMTMEKKGQLTQTVDVIILCVILFILIKEFRRCKIAYKYSIISDKLIINKINSNSEKNVESIKFKDILYIGEKCNTPKEYSIIKCNKYYTKNFNGHTKFCCVYKKDGKVEKFLFAPSNKLINCVSNIV
ncbi:MAG: hypothetical protein E7G24_17235, partial [Clostridium celatum]|nr:hypothetical protein [Clostridium celatum]